MPLVTLPTVTTPPPPSLTPEQKVKQKAKHLQQLVQSHLRKADRMFLEIQAGLKFDNAEQKAAVLLAAFGADGPLVLTYRSKLKAAVEALDGKSRTEG